MANLAITSAQSVKFAIPKNGIIRGVYSDTSITIGYDDNGSIGTMMRNVTEWEPTGGFKPAAIAYLVITAAAAANVAIRYEV